MCNRGPIICIDDQVYEEVNLSLLPKNTRKRNSKLGQYIQNRKTGQDCYKCIRECPVKAIRIENNKASIIAERCVYCGHCTQVCRQERKRYATA